MSKSQNILIIEDELIIANHLKSNLEQMGYHVAGIVSDYDSAIAFINSKPFDLALIDIKLEGEKTGIDVATYLKTNRASTPFVFLTSYVDPETIEKAKVTLPAGYLTKPFTPSSIFSTIEIALYNAQTTIKEQSITLSDGVKQIVLKKNEILYIESEHVYSNVVTSDHSYLIRSSISNLESLLPQHTFIRVHRGYIVNVTHIKMVTPSWILVEQNKIPVGKTFRDDLQRMMGL